MKQIFPSQAQKSTAAIASNIDDADHIRGNANSAFSTGRAARATTKYHQRTEWSSAVSRRQKPQGTGWPAIVADRSNAPTKGWCHSLIAVRQSHASCDLGSFGCPLSD